MTQTLASAHPKVLLLISSVSTEETTCCSTTCCLAVILQVVDTANAAHQGTQEMESECTALQAENQQLQSVVRSLEVQVSELQADVETRGSALESLEGTLSKIERSVDSGRDRSPLTGSLCVDGAREEGGEGTVALDSASSDTKETQCK